MDILNRQDVVEIIKRYRETGGSGSHPPAAHQLDGSLHTVSGLTAGHFLKALSATTFGFAAHGLSYGDVGADASGAAATVQGNLNTHAGLTTTAHGLGESAFHADAYFALAGHNHSGVYAPISHLHAWGDITSGVPSTWTPAAHGILDSTYHSDVLTGSITRGDILYGNSTPKIARLAKGTAGYLLTSDANDVKWESLANLGIQPLHANLTSLAGLSYASAAFVKMTAANTFSLDTTAYAPAAHGVTIGTIPVSATATTYGNSLITQNVTGVGVGGAAISSFTLNQNNINGDVATVANSFSVGTFKYGIFGLMGSTGFGITDWPNAFVFENQTATGPMIFASYGGSCIFQTNNRTKQMEIDNTGLTTLTPSTTRSSLRTGTLEMQSYAVNNGWYASNTYWNGSAFKYRATGYAALMQEYNGDLLFKTAPSGTAGNDATMTTRLTIGNTGTITFNAYGTGRPLLTAGVMSLAALTAAECAEAVTGTTNYLAKFTGENKVENSLIYDNGTRISIGAGTSPGNLLDVRPTSNYDGISVVGSVRPMIQIGSTTAHEEAVLQIANGTPNIYKLGISIAVNDELSLLDVTRSKTLLHFNAAGSVGIGTSAPGYKVHISSDDGAVPDGGNFCITDTKTTGQGVGGSMLLQGKYSGGVVDAGLIKAYKDNATVGNYAFSALIYGRPNGGAMANPLRVYGNGNVNVPGELWVTSKIGISTTNPYWQQTMLRSVSDGGAGFYGPQIVLGRALTSQTNTRASSIFHYYNGGSVDLLCFGMENLGASDPALLANAKMTIGSNNDIVVPTDGRIKVCSAIDEIYRTELGSNYLYGYRAPGTGAGLTIGIQPSSGTGFTSTGGYIDFATYPSGGSFASRMRIDKNGLVGINTTGQLCALCINGGVHIGGDSDAGDNNLLVDGTVGIGCTPITTLNVASSADTIITVESGTGSTDVSAVNLATTDGSCQYRIKGNNVLSVNRGATLAINGADAYANVDFYGTLRAQDNIELTGDIYTDQWSDWTTGAGITGDHLDNTTGSKIMYHKTGHRVDVIYYICCAVTAGNTSSVYFTLPYALSSAIRTDVPAGYSVSGGTGVVQGMIHMGPGYTTAYCNWVNAGALISEWNTGTMNCFGQFFYYTD